MLFLIVSMRTVNVLIRIISNEAVLLLLLLLKINKK
jgi:hypothetical protein